MNAASPRYAVNATSLPHSTVWQDIDDIAATGAEGIGLWERKLPDGADAEVAARLSEAGLAATYCVPALHCVLPSQVDPPGAPQDGPTRRALIAASIRRLAGFRPAAALIAPGASGDPAHPAGPVEAARTGRRGGQLRRDDRRGAAGRPPGSDDQLTSRPRGAA
jgi:sugar phosphate isomerase/epimerase